MGFGPIGGVFGREMLGLGEKVEESGVKCGRFGRSGLSVGIG